MPFNEVINFDRVDPLDVLTAAAQESISKLATLHRREWDLWG
jgi:hypothetical protein